jgi:hypothetical protein
MAMGETTTPLTGFLDIRLAGTLIANMLEDWLAAKESPTALAEGCHERQFAQELDDDQIAERFNQEGRRSATGQPFNTSMIQWIRYRHGIPKAALRHPEELTVKQVAEHFGVSSHVVYYWIEHGILATRRLGPQKPYWVTLDPTQEQALWNWVRTSSRIQTSQHSKMPL